MPEVKRLGKKAVEGFEPSLVDPETVPFRDKQREKQRQALLRQRAAASEAAATVGKGGGGNAGGRQQQQQQQQQQAVQQQQQQVRLTAAKRRKLEQQQELDDLEGEQKGSAVFACPLPLLLGCCHLSCSPILADLMCTVSALLQRSMPSIGS